MSDTEGLAAFWAARLDEAEAAAKAAAASSGPNWHQSHAVTACGATTIIFYGQDDDIEVADTLRPHDEEIAPFIARNDPLRSIEADRAILEAWQEQSGYDLEERVHDGRDPDERECDEALLGNLEMTARLRASVFSDHPDYRPVWKP